MANGKGKCSDLLLRVIPTLLVLIVVGLIFQYGVAPVDRDFRINDTDTSFPLKAESYGNSILMVFMAVVPLGTILLAHLVAYRADFFGHESRALMAEGVLAVLYVTFSTLVITSVLKNTVSRPRPHFLAVCQLPDDVVGDFASPSQCTGEESEVLEATKSFVSGHASASFASCVFAALYASKRVPARSRVRILLPLFHFVMFALASLIANSRITDFYHFPSDVLGGAIVGSAVAVIGFLNLVSPLTLHWWAPSSAAGDPSKKVPESSGATELGHVTSANGQSAEKSREASKNDENLV